MTGFISFQLAKCLRFSLGRFTNLWVSDEELNKPQLLKDNKFPKDVPSQFHVLRWQYKSPLLKQLKIKEVETRGNQESRQEKDTELRMDRVTDSAAELKGLEESIDANFSWLTSAI